MIVRITRVKVGHRQTPPPKAPIKSMGAFFVGGLCQVQINAYIEVDKGCDGSKIYQ
jgi:hypothetical protein